MIDIEKLEVGDKLIAIDECIMNETTFEDAGKAALKIGKQYPIIATFGMSIIIKSEIADTHHFDQETINQFFAI